ncbi:MAG: hypothetical protein R3D01_13065 [Hyphomicrobiales bacterium]
MAYAVAAARQGLAGDGAGRRRAAWPRRRACILRWSYTVGQTKSEDIALLPSILHAINLMQETADLRLERLSDVGGHLTPLIWGVLLLGGVITLAYTAFFATRQIPPQVLDNRQGSP